MSKNKDYKLSEGIVIERMHENGLILSDTTDIEERFEVISKQLGCKVVHGVTDTAFRYYYTEQTADSYELYIAADGLNASDVYMADNVFYDEHDWIDDMLETLRAGETIYLSKYLLEEDAWGYVVDELWQELYNEKYEEAENELHDEGFYW
jgi:hypothetical protein